MVTENTMPIKTVDEEFVLSLRILNLLFSDSNMVLTRMLTNAQKQNLIIQIKNLKESVYGNMMDEKIARHLSHEDDDEDDDDVYEH